MLSFLARRLLSSILLIFVLASVTFGLMFGATQNAARNILGETATEVQVEALEEELGLDRPLLVQYGAWLRGAATGDLGHSWVNGEAVASAIASRIPVTFSMVILATIAMTAISVLFGVAAAVRGGWIDKLIQVVSILGFAIPNYSIALLLVLVFAISLRWLPATGYVPFFGDPVGWARALILPVTALVVGGTASAAQQVRGAMKDVLRQDYIRTLRARGLSPGSILFRHALRNATPAALTVLSVQFISMLGGVVVIESVFATPGIGLLTVQSALIGDVPVLMAVVVTLVIWVSLTNLLMDLTNAWVNPKVRKP